MGSPCASGLHLILLGAAKLVRGDGEHHTLSGGDAALLTLLHAQGTLERSQVAAWIWPDLPLPRAQANLRQRLFRLHQWAGAAVVQGDRRRLIWSPACAVDVDELRTALAAGLAPDHDDLLATHDYADAPALAEQVDRLRDTLRASYHDALARLAEAHAARGALATALQHAQRLVQVAPLLEHAHRRVMHLHARRGDRAAALAAFRHCQRVLDEALAVRPSGETEMLAAQIEASAVPTVSVARLHSLLRPSVLVGRDEQQRLLQEACAAGRSTWLTGRAGEGRSTLLSAVFAALPGWVSSPAMPGDRVAPYSFLSRLLGVLVARFGGEPDAGVPGDLACLQTGDVPAPGPLTPLRMRQLLQRGLTGWRTVGLKGLALDDLQHADVASLDLLGPVIAEIQLPCAVASAPWHGSMPAWAADWRVVHLQPWCEADVEQLLDALALPGIVGPDWARALCRRTGGNPGLMMHTVSALCRALPDQPAGGGPAALPSPQQWAAAVAADVQRQLDAELAALPEDARALVRLASVAGSDFDLRLAARVTGRQVLDLADAWASLTQANVMAQGGFAHELFREAADRATPSALARLLHADVARALAEGGASPFRVAAHWAAAGEWAAAARACHEAAREAEVRSAVPDQIEALDEAVRCHRQHGGVEALLAAFDSAYRVVGLCLTAQSVQDAEARAQALLAMAASPRQRAMALEALAQVRLEQQAAGDALPLARQALALADAVADPVLALRARRRAAMACMQQGLSEQALALVTGLEPQLRHLDPAERVQWQLEHAAVLDYADRRQDALPHYALALETAHDLGLWATMADALSSQSLTLMYLGRQTQAMAALEASMTMSRRSGLGETALLVDRMSLAGHWRDAGWFGRYLAEAEPLPQALRDAGMVFWALNAENDLGMAYLWLGRVDLAWRCFGPVPDDAPAVMRAARLLMLARGTRDYELRQPVAPAELVTRAVALLEAAGGTGRSHVRLRLALERSRDAGPAAALAAGEAIESEALARDNLMLAASAAMQQLRVLTATPESGVLSHLAPAECQARAARVAQALLDRIEADGPPASIYPPELWWLCYRALVPLLPQAAAAVHRRAWLWLVETANQQVPDLFRDSFWARNPVNRAWRALGRPS